MYINCHSYFSFKYGLMSIEELLTEAQSKKIDSLVLTDINNTSGCLDFVRHASKFNIKPILGIDFRDGATQQYIGIAKNNEGFQELNQHLTKRIASADLKAEPEAFKNAYVIYPFGLKSFENLNEGEYIGIRSLDFNKLIFTDWQKYQHKLIVLHPVTFRNKKDFNAHRLLRAIDNNTLLSKLPLKEQAQESEIMLGENELKALYNSYPQLIENTKELLSNCHIDFEFGKSKNKQLFTGNAAEDISLLKKLTYEGLEHRYTDITEQIKNRVEKELKLIHEMGFCAYFLINWDIIQFAQSRGFFHVGRGSGANSIVAYSLKITNVDPIDLDLYFERFINEHRVNPPDFDLDFSWKDRDEIIAYIFNKYGTVHTALLATYSTFQYKSIVRELAKVFGLPKAEIDDLLANKQITRRDNYIDLIKNYGEYLKDIPNHLSIHAGGILISEKPITAYTALSFPPKGFPITQFSMLEAEDIGLYKFDILSQRGLGHIRDTVSIIKQNRGIDIDIHNIKAFKEDEKIKENLRNGKTIGCFYVESPAMRMLLTKLKADTYIALVAASSIIRPGVAQSGMMREYILRFKNPETTKYIHPKMEELMKETFGIMVYQEDVIKVAHHFAGLSLAEADVLRRGMSGKFRSREEFRKAQERFFECCKEKGYDETLSAEVWRQIESFAGYSFSKGHSASYAVESYQSLYLKTYFPKEFMVGVINNFGGFYNTEFYVHEARMCGANVLAPCINNSDYLTTIQDDNIYLGFIHMGETQQKVTEQILNERLANGTFSDLENFIKRINISLDQLRIFIRIGAFRFTGKTKKELLWQVHVIIGDDKKTLAKKELFEMETKKYSLPPLQYHKNENAFDEIEILGFSLSSPFSLLKNKLQDTVKATDLITHIGKTVKISGYLVCIKYTRTIKGDIMMFGTFIDEQGHFIDTIHFPNIVKQYPFRGRACYLITGKISEDFGFASIDVSSMEKLEIVCF